MKHCFRCKATKPYSEFHKNKSMKDGYTSGCKTCNAELQQARYAKNIGLVQRYKVMKGCARCGYKGHPAALTLDHIDPLSKSTNHKTNGAAIHYLSSLKKIKDEIRKCQVLCANCHNIKTFEEGDYKIRK